MWWCLLGTRHEENPLLIMTRRGPSSVAHARRREPRAQASLSGLSWSEQRDGYQARTREEMSPTEMKVRTDRDLWCVLNHFDADSVIRDWFEVNQEVRTEWNWFCAFHVLREPGLVWPSHEDVPRPGLISEPCVARKAHVVLEVEVHHALGRKPLPVVLDHSRPRKSMVRFQCISTGRTPTARGQRRRSPRQFARRNSQRVRGVRCSARTRRLRGGGRAR